ncbi:SURF1 family cytochrome oxidase biogenesis protein [Sphingorhabdus contaminans]|uniref:SURF1-like protein n=1 Tax=Sphingorhabdus contaminans TaxID=1343899 RepID=A0A553WB33_9SPHN|nr:SURF1 family cytochrome oxidase biogenesis protein [Sphingorhabdus contaminans]TSB01872.1 SURF1 family protein [Sphingorhabdus contaminans]
MKWPVIPTILVSAAVATMIGLGIWQLQRKEQKEQLLARYEAAANLPPVTWPSVPDKDALPLFRKSTLMCIKVLRIETVSGSNREGKAGFAHLASCSTGGAEGPGAKVAIGWSERPQSPKWAGGTVNGIIAPDNQQLIKLVVTDHVEGLQQLSLPSPQQIPNNHLLYAIQWFIFAAAAAIIYILALRKRMQSA